MSHSDLLSNLTGQLSITHVTWRHTTWHDVTPRDMTSHHVTWRHTTWHDGTPRDTTAPPLSNFTGVITWYIWHVTVSNLSRDSVKFITWQCQMYHVTVSNVSRDSVKCTMWQWYNPTLRLSSSHHDTNTWQTHGSRVVHCVTIYRYKILYPGRFRDRIKANLNTSIPPVEVKYVGI